MDGHRNETLPTDRAHTCVPYRITATSEKVEIGSAHRFCIKDEDGYGTLTTLWHEYQASLTGVDSGHDEPYLVVSVHILTVCAPTGYDHSTVIKDTRTERVNIAVRQLSPSNEDRRIRIDDRNDLASPPETFLVPESWVKYAWDGFDHAPTAIKRDAPEAPKPFRPKTVRKTAEARRDYDNPPRGIITARSALYPIRTDSEYTYRETVNGKTQSWATFGRSTFVARATWNERNHIVVTIEETMEVWVPGHDEVPVRYMNMKPQTKWIRTQGTSWDNELAQLSKAWNGAVTVSGEIHATHKHTHGSPSEVTFWIPRSWMKWTRPFPPARDAQTLETRGDGPKFDPIDEDERAETHAHDLETTRLKHRCWRDLTDHRSRRRHTGTARERVIEQRYVRSLRQNAERWLDWNDGLDFFREDPIVRLEREEARRQATEDAINEEEVWALYGRSLEWEESLMTSQDPLEEVYAEELHAKGDRPDSIAKIRDNALLEPYLGMKTLKSVFVKPLMPIPFAILNRPLSERYKLYAPIPLLKEGLWKRLKVLANRMEPSNPQTDDRLRQSRASVWNETLFPEAYERETGPAFQLLVLTRALFLADKFLERIVRHNERVREYQIDDAIRSLYLAHHDRYLH